MCVCVREREREGKGEVEPRIKEKFPAQVLAASYDCRPSCLSLLSLFAPSWLAAPQFTLRDAVEIARSCRVPGPFSRAALDAEELALLDGMMGRVQRLAQHAADTGIRLMVDAGRWAGAHNLLPLASAILFALVTQRSKRRMVWFCASGCLLASPYLACAGGA